MLFTSSAVSSSCTGSLSSDMALAVIEKTVNDSRHLTRAVSYRLVSCHELRIGIIRMLYGAHYDIVVLYVGTEDQGHDGGTRYILYALLNHRERVIAVYDAKDEIMLDAGETARVPRGGSPDLRYLLTKREKICISQACRIYKFRFRRDPNKDKNLFLYLGDNVSNRLTWSAVSKRIPTLRMSGGKTWHVMSRRWLTGRETLASLGFPVTASAADSMGVPELPVRDTKRASAISGNCMHFSTVAVVQFVALVCYNQTQ
ncbi:unnamed protein product [Polarella glacialis]|uniref:Uncharacterized protein n=1 Tax=Polarella glacialis TaxID=89957 RepID=A0A813KV29_POLGL|nr:unnamed protein product [Polarella glacialis]